MNVQGSLVKKEERCAEPARQYQVVTPLVDIYENEDEIVLHADMPGVARENLSIEINGGKLYLGGSRRMEGEGFDYKRIFSVPQTIEADKVSASLENGVLYVHLPRSEAAKPRQIKIEAR